MDSDDFGEYANSGQYGDYGESGEFDGSGKFSDSAETRLESGETLTRIYILLKCRF